MISQKRRMQLWTAVLLQLLATCLQLAAGQLDSSGQLLSATSTSSGSLVRLRATRIRRPEICRENTLLRKSEDLPALVIVGRIKELYKQNAAPLLLPTAGSQPAPTSQTAPEIGSVQQADDAVNQRALVNIGRVIKGQQDLVGSDIIVSGFNGTNATPCPNFVKPNDTWIMLLDRSSERKYSVQGNNLLSLNLNNLDRINAAANDEAYKRRPPIEDILCEAHYCAYGRCVVISERPNQVTCQCPDNCNPLPSPVCGSDNATYTNECHLIKEGCKRQRPLFVTKEAPC